VRLVVVVGTKGPFPRLVGAALGWLARDPARRAWIQHADPALTLPAGVEGLPLAPHADVLAALAAADVVLCHAGSGAVRDALRLGHVPVVVPRRADLGEHVNDHQRELVEALGDRIVACLAPEAPDDLDRAVARAAARRPAAAEAPSLPGEALRSDLRAAVVASRPSPRAAWVWPLFAGLTRPLRGWLRKQ
jgi:UDP-N-acetylglucosamine transferase subunit ALG13